MENNQPKGQPVSEEMPILTKEEIELERKKFYKAYDALLKEFNESPDTSDDNLARYYELFHEMHWENWLIRAGLAKFKQQEAEWLKNEIINADQSICPEIAAKINDHIEEL